MNTNPSRFGYNPAAQSQAVFDESLRKHMLRVYNYMGAGLVLTGLVAFIVSSTPALYVPIFSSPLKWVVMLAPLAFVFFFSFKIQTMSASTAQMTFWAFCAVMGLSLASVFLVFTGASIARTFFITATMFGATSLYGYVTKRDLSKFGSFLMMGLFGIIIASLVNMFMQSGTMNLIISGLGVLIFSGLIAYDTQRLKMTYYQLGGDQNAMGVATGFGALSLFINFVNLFQFLLAFMGGNRN